MKSKKKMSTVFTKLRVYFIVFIFIWTVLIVSLLIWGIYKEKNSYKTTVMNVAKSHLEKDHAFRFWQVSHGKVYVLTDKETPSDLQFGSITEHNTIIRSGKKFLLITYQYILQQINENFDELYDIGSRTISLDPLYLQNVPNSWETNALRLFEKGENEVSGFTTIGGKPYLQMMRPIIAKKHCKICGYKEGDILGGRSILLPLKNFIAESNKRITNLVIIFVAIWILVIFGMYIGYLRLKKESKERWLSVDKLIQKEQELEEAQYIAHIGDVVHIFVPEEKIYWSDEVFNIFGVEKQEASPRLVISCVHPDDRDKLRKAIKIEKLKKEKVFEHEFRIIRKDGEVRFIYQKGRKEFDEKGNLLKIHGTIQDITERKKAEKKLTTTMAELLKSNKELKQFVYIASHDLKEPLRTITSYIQLLASQYMDKFDKDADKYINYAVDGAKRMLLMINDLLVYSRIGWSEEEFMPVDCNSVFAQAMFNIAASIRESKAVIEADDLPTVNGIKNQLLQLFQNLLSNAIKYRGSLIPKIKITVEQKDKVYIFRVKDNGIGIDKGYYESIFEIFRRLHTRDEYEGTGIGLALCKKVVEQHKGKIWVESTVGKGSEFVFELWSKVEEIEHG